MHPSSSKKVWLLRVLVPSVCVPWRSCTSLLTSLNLWSVGSRQLHHKFPGILEAHPTVLRKFLRMWKAIGEFLLRASTSRWACRIFLVDFWFQLVLAFLADFYTRSSIWSDCSVCSTCPLRSSMFWGMWRAIGEFLLRVQAASELVEFFSWIFVFIDTGFLTDLYIWSLLFTLVCLVYLLNLPSAIWKIRIT